MKKFLMVATVPSMIGQFNMNNIQILLDMGYEVHVACNFMDRSVWTTERVEVFRQQLIAMQIKEIQIEFARTPYDIPKLIKAYRKLRKMIQEQGYAALHCHTPVAGMIARFAAFRTNTKVIYTAHGFHFFKGAPLKNWLLYYPVEKVCSYMTDVLITINKEDYALAQKKMKAKKVTYIPGVGVDLKKFSADGVEKKAIRRKLQIPNNGFLLLSVGELSERKNHQIVIRALAEIKNSNIYYCIAGIGPQKEKYEQMIEAYDLGENVFLLGHRTDIAELCQASDCFVHPSVREGLGIAPLEAMACGLPLISSYVNGIKDYTKDGISGCCVNPTSLEDMKKAIQKMYADSSFRQKCAVNNRRIVQEFSIEKSQDISEQIYCKNLGGGELAQALNRILLRNSYNSTLDDIVMISIGELSDNKNQKTVIKALSQMKNPKIKYWICGKGGKETELKELVRKLKLEKQVCFMGFQTDIARILKGVDVFCFPSFREGLPVALMEAMAAGLPVICSRIRGNADLIDENGGILFEPTCLEECKQAIEKISSLNQIDREKFGIYNRKKIVQFSLEKVNEHMKQLYQNIEA